MLGPRREEGVREVVGSAVAFRDLLPLLRGYFGHVALGFADGGANVADVRGERGKKFQGEMNMGRSLVRMADTPSR